MLRSMIIGLTLAGGSSAPVQDVPSLPGWLAGCWEERVGERWTEECWTKPRGEMMLGSGRSGAGEQVRDWEVMQIMRNDTDDPVVAKLTFYGMPQAQGRTAFELAQDGQPGLTFYNVEHDYPQRIRYWREGEELVAEVALADGSKARRWRYKRMGN